MLLTADHAVAAAGVFTTNKTIAAPVVVSREQSRANLAAVPAQSSATAAAQTHARGTQGMQVARSTVEFVARHIGCRPEEVLVASTGVIGVDLDLDKVTRGVALQPPRL